MLKKEFETLRDQAKKLLESLEVEYDLAALKAHLAKMDSEDKLEEMQKELHHLYGQSKIEIDKLSKKTAEELNDLMLKLTEAP